MRVLRLSSFAPELLGAIVACVACSGARDARPPGADTVAVEANAAAPTDTLVLRTPRGEVWLTDARDARDSTGVRCLERGVEIRRDTTALRVPLLYTGASPVLVNDSTLRADLWLHCRPMVPYLIDLHTGRPSPLER